MVIIIDSIDENFRHRKDPTTELSEEEERLRLLQEIDAIMASTQDTASLREAQLLRDQVASGGVSIMDAEVLVERQRARAETAVASISEAAERAGSEVSPSAVAVGSLNGSSQPAYLFGPVPSVSLEDLERAILATLAQHQSAPSVPLTESYDDPYRRGWNPRNAAAATPEEITPLQDLTVDGVLTPTGQTLAIWAFNELSPTRDGSGYDPVSVHRAIHSLADAQHRLEMTGGSAFDAIQLANAQAELVRVLDQASGGTYLNSPQPSQSRAFDPEGWYSGETVFTSPAVAAQMSGALPGPGDDPIDVSGFVPAVEYFLSVATDDEERERLASSLQNPHHYDPAYAVGDLGYWFTRTLDANLSDAERERAQLMTGALISGMNQATDGRFGRAVYDPVPIVSEIESAGRGALNALSLNFIDEAMSFINAWRNGTDRYMEADAYRAADQAAMSANPGWARTGQTLGTLAWTLTPAKAIVLGAASGIGQGTNTEERIHLGALGAASGAILGNRLPRAAERFVPAISGWPANALGSVAQQEFMNIPMSGLWANIGAERIPAANRVPTVTGWPHTVPIGVSFR